MKIKSHHINETRIGEVIAEGIVITNAEEGLDLMGELYYLGFDKIIIYEKNISPDFFDLQTGIAGEILQKFSTYRVQLAIVGDFSKYKSRSLKDFIFESNKGRHIIFTASQAEAVDLLSGN